MNDIQDAVTLAADLKLDPELATAITVSTVVFEHAEKALKDAEAAFEKARGTGSKAAYIRASNELTLARIHLEDLRRQAGL